MEANPCRVEWVGPTGPAFPAGCQFQGEIACPAICAQPSACTAVSCNAHGICELKTSQDPNGCGFFGDSTCQELESIVDQSLETAQSCLAGGVQATTECDAGEYVEDLCGCPHAVSSEQQIAKADALSAVVAHQAQCPVPERCQLLDCAQAGTSGTCQLTTHPDGICIFN